MYRVFHGKCYFLFAFFYPFYQAFRNNMPTKLKENDGSFVWNLLKYDNNWFGTINWESKWELHFLAKFGQKSENMKMTEYASFRLLLAFIRVTITAKTVFEWFLVIWRVKWRFSHFLTFLVKKFPKMPHFLADFLTMIMHFKNLKTMPDKTPDI